MRIHFSSCVRPKLVAKKFKASLSFLGGPVRLSEAQELTARLYGYQSWFELKASVNAGPRSLDDEQLAISVVAARREYQVARLVNAGVPLNRAEYAVRMIGPTASGCGRFESFEEAHKFFVELCGYVGATGFRFYTREKGLGTLALLLAGNWVEDPVRRVENAHQLNDRYPWTAGLSAVGLQT